MNIVSYYDLQHFIKVAALNIWPTLLTINE